jgi:glycosyltransferase involved in cell wall biosynthesis
MDRKKILFLHASLDRGGAEKLRHILLKNIDRERYDIRLCCISHKGEIGREIEQLGYEVDELGLDHNFKNIKTTFSIRKYLKLRNIDILHTSLFDANFHGRIAAFLCGIPHVITEEHSEHYQYQNIKYLPHIVSDFILAGKTKFIVACSETLRRDIIKKERLPERKVVVINNCIDPSMHRVNEPRDVIRKRLGIGEETVFITVASLSNRKGHEYLIDALGEIKRSGKFFKCILAGDGPMKRMLYDKCSDNGLLDTVIFLGNIKDATDYLNASDVFILPSLFEGMPLVIIEAMLMGMGCIVTDVGSIRELINDNVNGIIVPPADRERLKKAVLFCLENKNIMKDFGLRSKEIAQKYCLVDSYVKQFYNLWD